VAPTHRVGTQEDHVARLRVDGVHDAAVAAAVFHLQRDPLPDNAEQPVLEIGVRHGLKIRRLVKTLFT